MSATAYLDHEEIGFTREETRSMARRLFVASLVTALIFAVAVTVAMVSPGSSDAAYLAPRKITLVQQPIFVDQGIVAVKPSGIELP